MGTSCNVCVIIVTYNSERYIDKLCRSLLAYLNLNDMKIVFIDNASTDNTVNKINEILHGNDFFEIIRNNKNIGFGSANNHVMKLFESNYYLLLNVDTYVQSDIIEEMLSFYDNNTPDIVGPHLIYPDGRYQTSAYSFSSPLKWLLQDFGVKALIEKMFSVNSSSFILKLLIFLPISRPFIQGMLSSKNNNIQVETVDWITGACMLLSKRVFKKTGGFDENIFMYGEDEELCYRANKMGFKVERVYAGPVVHYCGWGSNTSTSRITNKMYDSLLYTINKNYSERPIKKYIMKKILEKRYKHHKV